MKKRKRKAKSPNKVLIQGAHFFKRNTGELPEEFLIAAKPQPKSQTRINRGLTRWHNRRHIVGDWGECCEEDKQANEDALAQGERLLSVYRTSKDEKIWVITEADRSSTCVLLPEEY